MATTTPPTDVHRWNASPKLEAGSPEKMEFAELNKHMRREGYTAQQMAHLTTASELSTLRIDSMPGEEASSSPGRKAPSSVDAFHASIERATSAMTSNAISMSPKHHYELSPNTSRILFAKPQTLREIEREIEALPHRQLAEVPDFDLRNDSDMKLNSGGIRHVGNDWTTSSPDESPANYVRKEPGESDVPSLFRHETRLAAVTAKADLLTSRLDQANSALEGQSATVEGVTPAEAFGEISLIMFLHFSSMAVVSSGIEIHTTFDAPLRIGLAMLCVRFLGRHLAAVATHTRLVFHLSLCIASGVVLLQLFNSLEASMGGTAVEFNSFAMDCMHAAPQSNAARLGVSCREKYKGRLVTIKGVVTSIEMEHASMKQAERFVINVKTQAPSRGFFAASNGAIKVVAGHHFQAAVLDMEPSAPISFEGVIVVAARGHGSEPVTVQLTGVLSEPPQ